MSTQQNNIIKLPVDLSPAQRAALKLYGHFALIALFNGAMAGFVLITNGQYFTWQTVALVAFGQAVLALLDALKKYYSASNQLPLSTLFDLIRQDAASKITPVSYTPNQQAIVNSVNALLAQTDASPNAAQNASKPVVLSPTPTESASPGAEPTTSAAQTTEYKIPDNAQTQTTLPNLAAIQNQQNAG